MTLAANFAIQKTLESKVIRPINFDLVHDTGCLALLFI